MSSLETGSELAQRVEPSEVMVDARGSGDKKEETGEPQIGRFIGPIMTSSEYH